ncbi:hypothetical protein JB92DRAFT_3139011 [Gautieria morchelliformis]|nr:hypothetical protein JB92DRAFT_3139011 [Gautieria morchelliformis]
MQLFLKHRSGPLARRPTKNGVEYLSDPRIARLGIQRLLAILYSFPYASLIWAMATYIAAILAFAVNNSAVPPTLLYVIIICLEVPLAGVIVCFWRDDLQLMDNLRSCRDSMRSLSPIGLVHLVGRVARRGHNPEAANISVIRHWVRRAMGSINAPEGEC